MPKMEKIPKSELKKCLICGGLSSFKYYSIPSCEACKQFFRRTVMLQILFVCKKSGNCELLAAHNMRKCCGCRLNKCLTMGMEPKMVNARKAFLPKKFLEILYKRKMELLSKQKTLIHPLANDDSTDQSYQLPSNQMPSPMDVVELSSPKNERKIYDKNGTTNQSQSETEEPAKEEAKDFPLNAFPLAKSQIGIDRAISAKTAETFDVINHLSCVQFRVVKCFAMDRKVRPELINQYTSFRELLESRISILNDMDKFTVQIEHQWERNWDQLKCLHLFTLLDLFRSIPAFCMIDLDDQVRLANYVGSAVYLMSTNFHSNIVKFDAENEFKLSKLLNNANLCLEEFLLLRAIVICHSSVSYLSKYAKSQIQFESERYASCLMHFLRLKHGNEKGIMRYAEVIHMAEQLFYAQNKLHSHLTFMAMVTHQDKFYEATPSPFVPMLLNGYE